jgi:hypothetical protein
MKILAATSILFHVTSLLACSQILRDKVFRLKPTTGTAAEQEIQPKQKYPYYLSMMRGLLNRYNSHRVAIQMDGQLLASRYLIRPIDYWGAGPQGSEQEDRLWSPNPTVPVRYVAAIHIGTKDLSRKHEQLVFIILKLAKMSGIPVYFYSTRLVQSTHPSLRIKYRSITKVRLDA